MKPLNHYWYSQNPVAWMLLPLSWLFCLISFIRRQLYASGAFTTVSFDIPVVIIGNISVGGSGKTPLLIAVCEYLKRQGKKPGVVSRGYGGTVEGVKQLTEQDKAIDVGDEPSMIFQRTHCPVVVGRDRAAAVALLLKNNDCDIVLSDDGLQHYRLHRHFEIAVVDAKRQHGNGFCLPAGPLREKPSRLKTVDLVVYNSPSDKKENKCFYTLQYEQAVNLLSGEKKSLQAFLNRNIIAVAGIGYPDRFFELLKNEGLSLQPQAFSDHHDFTEKDILPWSNQCVLMTEKDAVKCRYLVKQKSASSHEFSNVWYLPVTAVFSDELKNSLRQDFLSMHWMKS